MSRRVTYDEAVALKKIGYNEPSDAFYAIGHKDALMYAIVTADDLEDMKERGIYPTVNLFNRNFNSEEDKVAAPTLDTVLDWAEEKYDIKLSVNYDKDKGCYENSYRHVDSKIIGGGFSYHTRDEAKAKLLDGIIYIVSRLLEKA